MILKELADLAIRENMVVDPDFEMKPVTWIITLSSEGLYVDTQRTVGKKEGKKTRAIELLVPRGTHSNKVDPLFLVDNAKYVLGKPGDKDQDPERATQCAKAFKALVEEAAEATGDASLKAVHRFLADRSSLRRCLKDVLEEARTNDLFAFRVGGEFVHDRENVRQWWKQRRLRLASAEVGQCLVTGRKAPLAALHVDIKGVPGPSFAGAPLVSFNQNAFESYALRGNDNAPVSEDAATAYGTALNRLLLDPSRSAKLGQNTVAVFWARSKNVLVDSFAALLSGNADEVKALYDSVWQGGTVLVNDPSKFFSVILCGVSKGRISIRSWLMSTVQDAVESIKRYFKDIAVVPRAGTPAPLWMILKSLAPKGDMSSLPPDLGQRIFEAALFGMRLPHVILEAAVRRCRSERAVTPERAGLIKAYLIRKGKEVSPHMDESNMNPGYILGRLFAELETMQRYALGDIGANIVDRYFAAACATPQAVFPRLMKLEMHHFRKAREEKPSAAHAVQRRIDGLCAKLQEASSTALWAKAGRVEGFPRFLPLEQQGQFVLGYHCQMHHNSTQAAAARASRECETPSGKEA